MAAEGCGIAAFGGDEYEVSVTGFRFVSQVVYDGVLKPPSFGRGCRRRRRRIGASVLPMNFRTYPQGFAQLLPEEGALRYGIFLPALIVILSEAKNLGTCRI